MSVSFVVAVGREEVYQRVSRPWLLHQVENHGAELIERRGASSIFEAYEFGRQQAKNDLICYVHDDVRLLSPSDLSEQITTAFAMFPKLGVLGPVGKVERARVPWWLNRGNYVGHWFRRGTRGQLVYQMGDDSGRAPYVNVTGDPVAFWEKHRPRWDRFANAGLTDGFFIIENRSRMTLSWDADYGPHWHGYDVDRCFQAHSLGLDVMVSPWLFLHDNAGHAGYKGSDRATLPADKHTDPAGRQIKSAGDALWLADLDVVNVMVRRKWGLE